jgi:catechol 2,3-dioxygenase-like lactoylglutathione lyase family enzyme
MDFKLELLLLPVADLDRAKEFYVNKVGFNLDVDTEPAPGFRIVQMTPPGSACSITIGTTLELSEPGSIKGTHLVVSDIEAARAELHGRGVEISEVTHFENGQRVPGVDPGHARFNSYADFADPDGNTWVLQEVDYVKA